MENDNPPYITKTIRLALLILDYLDALETLSQELKAEIAELIKDHLTDD